jgi:hypothetical protein
MRRYQVLGTLVGADTPLPELPPMQTAGRPEILVLSAPQDTAWLRRAASARTERPDQWSSEHTADGILLRRPEIADFLLGAEAALIRYRREPSAADAAFRSALIDQVLPRAIAHRGGLVVHAGTVAIAGRAFCLAGPSGMGKSTLTMAFARAGHAALADDTARLQPTTTGVSCMPAYHGARLREDSLRALSATPTIRIPAPGNREKFRCRPQNEALARAQLPLGGIVFLARSSDEDCAKAGGIGTTKLRRLGPAEALAALMSQVLVLDPRDTSAIGHLFAVASKVITRVPAHLWSFPSGYDHLHQLVEHLAAALDG